MDILIKNLNVNVYVNLNFMNEDLSFEKNCSTNETTNNSTNEQESVQKNEELKTNNEHVNNPDPYLLHRYNELVKECKKSKSSGEFAYNLFELKKCGHVLGYNMEKILSDV